LCCYVLSTHGFCLDSAVSGMFAVREIGPHDPGLFSSFIPEVAPRRWFCFCLFSDLLPENARIGLNFIYFRLVCTSFICLGLLRIVSWTILSGGRDPENESCPRDHILPWTSFYIWPDLDFLDLWPLELQIPRIPIFPGPASESLLERWWRCPRSALS